jgi:hypothetical protein
MLRLEAAALKMAAYRFEEFVRTTWFMLLGEEAPSIYCWTITGGMAWRGGGGPVSPDGGGLPYRVVGMVGGEDGEWMAGVVAEALRAKAARRVGAVEVLGRKAVVDRVGLG